jgi:hypothetical protein
MKKGTELSDWNGKFPKRYNCQNPYTKCEFCCHKDPCVPDYVDEFRKEPELTTVDKFAIWLVALALTVAWMLFVKF